MIESSYMIGCKVRRVMQSKSTVKLVIVALAALQLAAFGQGQNRRPAQGAMASANWAKINLIPSPESPSEFSLIISDGDEQVVSGSFVVEQLKTIRDLMVEAKKFALTEEAVGAKEPV